MKNEDRYKVFCVPEKLTLLNCLLTLGSPLLYYKKILYWHQFTGFFIPENSDNWVFMIDRIVFSTDLKKHHKYIGLGIGEEIILDKDGERNDTDVDWFRIIEVDNDMKNHPIHSLVLDEIDRTLR